MIVSIHKPKGPTSHDIIDQVRAITGEQRVGHAGTLDPLASGVLVVAIGRESTKKLSEEVAKEKEYLATIKLGETTTTDDSEGEKTAVNVSHLPTGEEIKTAVKHFIGQIQQQPPAYSALKLKGQPAYKLARLGQTPELTARPVEIKTIEVINYHWPMLELRVVTGPGVYIRALARDLGDALKTGGYLADLIRTRVGDYQLDQALTTETLAKHLQVDKPGS